MNAQMCLATLTFMAAFTLAAVEAAVSPPQGLPLLPAGVASPVNTNAPQIPARPAGLPAKGDNSDDLNAESTFGIGLWGLGGGWGGWGGYYGGGWGGRYGGWGGWGYPYRSSYYRPYYSSWGWGW